MRIRIKHLMLVLLVMGCSWAMGQKSTYIQGGVSSSKLSPYWKGTSDIKAMYFPHISINFRRALIRNTLYCHLGVGYQRVGESMNYSTFEEVFVILNDEVTVEDVRSGKADPSDYRIHEMEVTSDYELYLDMVKFPVKLEYQWNNFQVMSGVYLANTLKGNYAYTFLHPYHIYYDVEGEKDYDLVTGKGHINSNDLKTEYEEINVKQLSYGFLFSIGYKWNQFGVNLTYEQGLSYLDQEDRTVSSISGDQGESSFQYRHPEFFRSEEGRLKLRNFSFGLIYYLGSGHGY